MIGGHHVSIPSLGEEIGKIARLAGPIVLAQCGLTLLGLVDVAVLGHASATELGGASIGRSIGFVAIALGLGVSGALEPLAAQAVGASEPHVAWRAFVATLKACVLVWAPCAVLAIASTWALEPLGIAAELVQPARAFLVANLPGFLGFAIFLAAKAYLQAHGRTSPALVAALLANPVNFVVCNVLVRGEEAIAWTGLSAPWLPRLGALGAGLSGTIASAVLAGWALAAALRLRPSDDAGGRSGAELSTRKVLGLALPIGLQLLAEIGVFSLVAVLAGRLGEVAVSAHQIAIGLATFTFMGSLGVSAATAVRVGHAIGERRTPRRAGLVGIGVGAGFMVLSGPVFLLFPRPLASLFTDDPAIVALAVDLLFIAAAFQLFDGLQAVAAGALRGAADVRFAFVANVAAHWLVGLPLALLLAFRYGLGARGLWWGLLVGLGLVAALLVGRFLRITRGLVARV
jgi:multidrug resistance protein, MATE family